MKQTGYGPGFFLAFVALSSWVVSPATEVESPQATSEEDFAALRTASPFARVLDPAQTYSLRGVAQLDDVSVATLYNRETKESFLVTPDGKGAKGFQLVEIERNLELDGVKARVSFAGEEVELIYDPAQFAAAPRTGPSDGGKGGDKGKRKGPSKEELDRFRSLPPEKQKVFQQYFRHVIEKYPNLPREERANMMRGALIRLTDGKELDFQSGN
ncbi:MAG: hypothetical protein AAGF67_02130 [Verrucomicrobiota bacterium]